MINKQNNASSLRDVSQTDSVTHASHSLFAAHVTPYRETEECTRNEHAEQLFIRKVLTKKSIKGSNYLNPWLLLLSLVDEPLTYR